MNAKAHHIDLNRLVVTGDRSPGRTATRSPTVPYQHSLRLKAALDKAGVQNELFTVPGGHHGGFTAEQYVQVYGVIKQFLKKQGLHVR